MCTRRGRSRRLAAGVYASLLITGGPCLRCNWESSCSQGFSSADVRSEPFTYLSGYGKVYATFSQSESMTSWHSSNSSSISVVGDTSLAPRLHQKALGAALGVVVAGLVLAGGQAKALVVPVTVGGLNYEVTTFTGSYDANASKFTTTDMPWWGNTSLADQFAVAVGNSFGATQQLYDSSISTVVYGPLFSVGGRISYVGAPYDALFSWAVAVPNGTVASFHQLYPTSDTFTYATATLASSPPAPSSSVPGPLPALGLAAAFGFSRQLRKRIKRHRSTSVVSTSPGT